MAKVIMMCGRICSGKTTYSQRLRIERGAVVLSVDEITLALFGQNAGEKHDDYVERAEKYLFEKSLEIIGIGVDAVLDWGFWTRAERQYSRDFYSSADVDYEFHYIDISDEEWRRRLEKRNKAVDVGKASAYYVDEGLAAKCNSFFERPDETEIDVMVVE